MEGHICYIFNFPFLMWHVVSPLTVVQGTSVWKMSFFLILLPFGSFYCLSPPELPVQSDLSLGRQSQDHREEPDEGPV